MHYSSAGARYIPVAADIVVFAGFTPAFTAGAVYLHGQSMPRSIRSGDREIDDQFQKGYIHKEEICEDAYEERTHHRMEPYREQPR